MIFPVFVERSSIPDLKNCGWQWVTFVVLQLTVMLYVRGIFVEMTDIWPYTLINIAYKEWLTRFILPLSACILLKNRVYRHNVN